MKTESLRGVSYPEVGDSIPGGIEAMVKTMGVIRPVDSIAAAQVLLSASSWEPTASNPAYFNINGLFYYTDGTHDNFDPSAQYVLKPFNPIEYVTGTANIGQTFTAANGVFTPIISGINLDVAPYDRMVRADGQLWGDVTGTLNLQIRINGYAYSPIAQFQKGASNQTQTTFAIGTVYAGQEPDIQLGILGGEGGGSIYLSWDYRWNSLMLQATPAPMK